MMLNQDENISFEFIILSVQPKFDQLNVRTSLVPAPNEDLASCSQSKLQSVVADKEGNNLLAISECLEKSIKSTKPGKGF